MTGHDVHLLKTGERFVGATGMDSHHHLSNFLISGLVQNWHGFAVASLLPQQHIMERGVGHMEAYNIKVTHGGSIHVCWKQRI